MDRMGVLVAAMLGKIQEGEARAPAPAGEVRESELLAAMAAGDRAAAELLVERTYRGVYSFLRRLCGDPDLSADLTPETYPNALDALAGIHAPAQFSTWPRRTPL